MRNGISSENPAANREFLLEFFAKQVEIDWKQLNDDCLCFLYYISCKKPVYYGILIRLVRFYGVKFAKYVLPDMFSYSRAEVKVFLVEMAKMNHLNKKIPS